MAGLSGITIDATLLPEGVVLDEAAQLIKIERPSNDVKTVTEALKLIELEFQSKPVTEWALAKAGS